ncbi:MAG: OmpA family protein [Myxococcales bacterium]|nr:OmpA family protein [Myxococcales bacterium]
MTDDLTSTFPAPASYSIQVVPASGSLVVNAGYDGNADPNLLAGTDTLAVGATATITFTLRFDPNGLSGPFNNTANGNGQSPFAVGTTDASDDGVDPDPNGNGDPTEAGENDPTPIMPAASTFSLLLTKQASRAEVSVGDMLEYAIVVENRSSLPLADVEISDRIPPAFQFLPGSARLVRGKQKAAPIGVTPGRPVVFGPFNLALGETVRVRYFLRVGAGVLPGTYVNRADATYDLGTPIGNTAKANVKVVPDPILEQTTVIGKVFHDADGDGWQDSADATHVTLWSALLPVFYVPQGTTVDWGDGPRPVPDTQDGSPLLSGLDLGTLPGRSSVAGPMEGRRVVVRAKLRRSILAQVWVESREGFRVRVIPNGHSYLEPSGRVKRGTTSQELELWSDVELIDGVPTLKVEIANQGLHEEGIPGVRIATTAGLLIETDAYGRYHVADVDGGRFDRGRNFILKVDPATLPPGAVFTTENPRVVHLTPGLMMQANFGIQLPVSPVPEKIVSMKIGELFFESDHATLTRDAEIALMRVARTLNRYRRGVIRIEGNSDLRHTAQYNLELALRRAEVVRRVLQKLLGDERIRYVEIYVDSPTEGDEAIPVDPTQPVDRGEEPQPEWEPEPLTQPGETPQPEAPVSSLMHWLERGAEWLGGWVIGTAHAAEFPEAPICNGHVCEADPQVWLDASDTVEIAHGRPLEPVTFRVGLNHDPAQLGHLERWELVLFRASDGEGADPIRTILGRGWEQGRPVIWDGAVRPGETLQPGDELLYVVRVYDAQGLLDESVPQTLRLREASVETLESAATAAEFVEVPACEGGICSSGPGFAVEVVSHGEGQPRSFENTPEGLGDNRRVDVSGTFVVRLPGRGSVWATEDPTIVDPRLNVKTNPQAAIEAGHLSEPVRFYVYTNYAAFLERWELLIFRATDGDLNDPIETISGQGLAMDQPIEWTGSVRSGVRLRAGDELAYVLRVYDADGHADETVPKSFSLRDAGRTTRDAATDVLAEEEAREPTAEPSIYGTSALARQTIPIRGSRVRVYADLADIEELRINGERVPVDASGRFAREWMLPVGEHVLEVEVVEADGEVVPRKLPIEVRGKYFFLVGLANLTVGQNHVSGAIEPLSADDHYDGDVFVDGRLAFYLKGKIRGRYLITAQADTTEAGIGQIFTELDHTDPQRLFRNLDQDRFYPVYGDDSTTISDVDTQGRFYVRLEWDHSQLLWGNYDTGITGNEFTQYNRSLYGLKLDHQSVSTTEFGEHRRQLIAFGSEVKTAFAHNEFLGTGGSLYYLKNTDIVQGSEKVRVEVRDRDSFRVVQNVTLERGRDYEIDEIQGRIILALPLSQVVAGPSPSIIKDEPLDGDEVFLLVDYEFVPDGFDVNDLTYGVRGKAWVTDHLAAGGTFVHENRDGVDYELRGGDLTLRVAKGTYLKGEYAQSEGTQASEELLSVDGGLTFAPLSRASGVADRGGDAINVEGRADFGEVTGGRLKGEAAAWWKRRDAGFSTASSDTGTRTTEYGGEFQWTVSDALVLSGRGTHRDRENELKERALSLQADYRFAERWQLGGEVRDVLRDPAVGPSEEATLGGLRLGWDVTSSTHVYVSGETALRRNSHYDANNMGTLGVRSKLSDRWTLRAEASAGNRGESVLLGTGLNLTDRYELYANYTMSTDRTDGERGLATFGQRVGVSDQLQVFTENQFTHGDRQSGLAQVYGLNFAFTPESWLALAVQSSDLEDSQLGSIERDAVSLSAGYTNKRARWRSKVEIRLDRGDVDRTQWLTANLLEYRLTPSFRLLGGLNGSVTRDQDAMRKVALFVEANAGFAYRPVGNDRLNLLGKYTYLYDLPSEGQDFGRTDESSHVGSLEGMYRLLKPWSVGGKVAYKYGKLRADRDDGPWFRTQTLFYAARTNLHFLHKWDVLAEYRWLEVEETKDRRQGALAALYRHIGKNAKIGVGYNFSDFDDDLTNLDYKSRGWFVTLIGKF